MNVLNLSFEIATGYEFIERINEVDLYSACEMLTSRKQNHITYVKRTGDRAQVITHFIKCPHCGKEAYAYSHYHTVRWFAQHKRSLEKILSWADIQPSMLGESENILYIQSSKFDDKVYTCKWCGYASQKVSNRLLIEIEYTDNKLFVKKPIKNLTELVSLKWLKGTANMNFPLSEIAVFDFSSRNTYLEIESDGNCICSHKVTDSVFNYDNDALVDLFQKNIIIKRTVKRLFEKITGESIAFSVKELDFFRLVELLRFTGFPKNFYYAIPYWENANVIDDSFCEIANKISNPQAAMMLLKNSTIPDCKSVKRVFTQNSGLFFYIKECEFLYSVLDDVNLFCSIINKDFIFQFLSIMHHYDYSLKTFLKDYSSVMGKAKLVNKFNCCEFIVGYAMFYSSLSEYIRIKEQEKWLLGVNVFRQAPITLRTRNSISIPLYNVTENMKNAVVDKHRIVYLRTKKECINAGERLDNCLTEWDSSLGTLAVVYNDNKMVAAIEISKNEIVQARRKNNKAIEEHSELYYVIKKWAKHCGIDFDIEKLNGLY